MDKFRCLSNRRFTIVFSALLLILLGASFCPARADNTDPLSRLLNQAYAEQQALKTEIEHRRAVLRRSCAGSISLMQDLVKLGNQYNMQLEALGKKVEEEVSRHKAFHDEFVSSADGEGKVRPGRFFKAFLAMQDKAEKAGILAEGPRPQGTPKDMLVLTPQAHKYFFFEEDETKAGQMNETRYELEEAQEKFFEDFNTRREEYYKAYSDSALEKINGAIEDLYNNIYKTRKKCLEKQEQLLELALTGKYEHCLGFMKTISHKTVVAANDQEGIPQLFSQGSVSTPEGLPGMGFNLTRPMKFPPIQRQEVQDWPYYLYFKSNGTSKLKNVIERRKIQIEAEREYILTLGRSWRDVCTLGLTKLIPPEKLIEQLPDGPIKDLLDLQEKASATFFKSFYGASLQATKALAAPIEMFKEAASHPIDSVESVARGVLMFSSGHPDALNAIDNFNKQIGNMIEEAGSTLAGGVLETLDDFKDPNRFNAREGESLFAQAERLTAQLESMQKVRKATDLAEKAVGEIVVALTGEAQIRAGVKMLSVGKTAVGSMSEVVRLEAKAANALKRTETLLAEAKAAKVTLPPRITEEIPKLPPAGIDKTVREAGREILENNRKLEIIEYPPPKKIVFDEPANPKHTEIFFSEDGSDVFALPLADKTPWKEGGFNQIYRVDDKWLARVADVTESDTGKIIDNFGRKVLEEEVKSPHIRVVQRAKEPFEGVTDMGNGTRKYYTEIVENMPQGTALDVVQKQPGKVMTNGQKIALEQAKRDMNKAGYVWMDDTFKNYTFENLPGDDRWRIVVLDPGGIYPVKGATVQEIADNARKMQKAWGKAVELDSSGVKNITELMFNKNFALIKESGGLELDLERLGFEEGSFPAAAYEKGDRFYSGNFETMDDSDFIQAANKHKQDSLSNLPEYKSLKQDIDEGVEKLEDLTKASEEASEEIAKALEKSDQVDGRPKNRGAASAVLGMPLDEKTAGAAKAMTDFSALQLKKVECARFLEMLHSGVDRATLKKMGNPCEDLQMAQ